MFCLEEGCSAALSVLENCLRNFSEGSSGESKNFFQLPAKSTIPVVHLELRLFQQIFKKIWNGPNGILRGMGETYSWKNLKSKISWLCPFKLPFGCTKLYIVKAPDILPSFLANWDHSHAPYIRSLRGTEGFFPDFQPMRVSEESIYINIFWQNPIFTCLHVVPPLETTYIYRISYIVYPMTVNLLKGPPPPQHTHRKESKIASVT